MEANKRSSVILGTVLIEHRSKVTRTRDGGELVLASVFNWSWSLIKLIMSLEKLETIFSYEPGTNNSNNLNYNFDNLVEIRFSYNPQEYNHSQSIWFVPYIVLVIIIVKFGSQNDSSNYFKICHISDVSSPILWLYWFMMAFTT